MAGKRFGIELEVGCCRLYDLDAASRPLGSIHFSNQQANQKREELQSFLKEKLLQIELDELVVAYLSPQALLVPSAVFENKEKESLFRAAFTQEVHANEIDYNRLAEEQLVVIYEIPLWVKSLFVSVFPKSMIQHHYSHSIRGIMKNSFRIHVQLEVYEKHCFIEVVDNGRLLLANSYEIHNEQDLIYYLSFALQQLNIKVDQKWFLNIHIGADKDMDFEQLSRNLKRISTYKNAEISLFTDKKMKQLLLCV